MNRSEYIGSSDARHIMTGDFDVIWNRRTRTEEPPQSFAMLLGQATEQVHLDWTTTALGAGYKWSMNQLNGDQHFAVFEPDVADVDLDPGDVILGSHPDALLLTPNGDVTYPLEAKLTARWRTIDEAIEWYMPQLQHHMICWQTTRLLFSVVIGTNEPERAWVGFSTEWADIYLRRCADFTRAWKAGKKPAPLIMPGEHATAHPVVPQSVMDAVPINGTVRRDMSQNNRFKAIAGEYLNTRDAAAAHDKAKKDLKTLMEPNDREIYTDEIKLKRDARGAIRITVTAE
jgi:hypothetical protein